MGFHHKNIEYFIGFCMGKYTIAIPAIKNFFKEYSFHTTKENQRFAEADDKAKSIIENHIQNDKHTS